MTMPRKFAFSILFAACASQAVAQYGAPAPQAPRALPTPRVSQATPEAAPTGQLQPSKAARNAIVALQNAVRAKDAATIPARAAAARAVASTPTDNYLIARFELEAAIDSANDAAISSAIQAVLATNLASPKETATLHLNLAKLQRKAKDFDGAATSLERVIALDPANADAMILLGETRNSQERPADAVGAIQRAIAASVAAGTKPPQAWYQRSLAIAYKARLPIATKLSRDWVAAYPTPDHWRDALRIHRNLGSLDEQAMIDLLRLQRATWSLLGEGDYRELAMLTLDRGQASEAVAVLEEAAAAKIDLSKPYLAQLRKDAIGRAPIERSDLAANHAKALSGPTARAAVRVGDSYYGIGEYAKAAELYRAALGKQGADASLTNLHLGMALARAGDKAGATAALNAVTGPRAELAQYWLLYLSTRA